MGQMTHIQQNLMFHLCFLLSAAQPSVLSHPAAMLPHNAVCDPEHRRLLLKINFQRISIAAGKGIALRRMEKRRRHSRDRRQAFFSPRKRRYGTQQSPRIRMTGIIKNLIHGSNLYYFPAYITATRSAIRATTPRSCVTKTVAVPSFF